MLHLPALMAIGYIRAARLGVDVIHMDLANGKTVTHSWADGLSPEVIGTFDGRGETSPVQSPKGPDSETK